MNKEAQRSGALNHFWENIEVAFPREPQERTVKEMWDRHDALREIGNSLGFSEYEYQAAVLLWHVNACDPSKIAISDIRRVASEMRTTTPRIIMQGHAMADQRIEAYFQGVLGTTNMIATGFRLAELREGKPSILSADFREDRVKRIVQTAQISVENSRILDLFAGTGWVESPFLDLGASEVFHIGYDSRLMEIYELTYQHRAKRYHCADIYALSASEIGMLGKRRFVPYDGAVLILPDLDITPKEQTRTRFVFSLLSDSLSKDGWILLQYDPSFRSNIFRTAKETGWKPMFDQEDHVVFTRTT